MKPDELKAFVAFVSDALAEMEAKINILADWLGVDPEVLERYAGEKLMKGEDIDE